MQMKSRFAKMTSKSGSGILQDIEISDLESLLQNELELQRKEGKGKLSPMRTRKEYYPMARDAVHAVNEFLGCNEKARMYRGLTGGEKGIIGLLYSMGGGLTIQSVASMMTDIDKGNITLALMGIGSLIAAKIIGGSLIKDEEQRYFLQINKYEKSEKRIYMKPNARDVFIYILF